MNITEVILPPVNFNTMYDPNLEPQQIKSKPNNESNLYIDSKYKNVDDVTNFSTGYVQDSRGNSSTVTIANKIRMITPNFINLPFNSPNVNPRNNQLTFFSTNSAAFHTVTFGAVPLGPPPVPPIQQGFYLTPNDLLTEIVAALNTVTGASGLTFSFAFDPNSLDKMGLLSAAGGSFHFRYDPVGNFLESQIMDKQKYLWNPPLDQTDTVSKRFGCVLLFYTRYITLTSNAINQYTKNPSGTNDRGNTSVLVRSYFSSPAPGILGFVISQTWRNYNVDQQLTSIDFQLRDEWDDLLYIPCDNIDWNIVLQTVL